VGIDHDTAEFAVEAIWRWWQKMGSERYPKARKILIMADGGGSNASRSRLWKAAIQKLSYRLDYNEISVNLRSFADSVPICV
jgi:hypothetical protein